MASNKAPGITVGANNDKMAEIVTGPQFEYEVRDWIGGLNALEIARLNRADYPADGWVIVMRLGVGFGGKTYGIIRTDEVEDGDEVIE